MSTLNRQSNGPLYSNTVIGTLAVDRWAVTFGTARRGLGGTAGDLECPSRHIDLMEFSSSTEQWITNATHHSGMTLVHVIVF